MESVRPATNSNRQRDPRSIMQTARPDCGATSLPNTRETISSDWNSTTSGLRAVDQEDPPHASSSFADATQHRITLHQVPPIAYFFVRRGNTDHLHCWLSVCVLLAKTKAGHTLTTNCGESNRGSFFCRCRFLTLDPTRAKSILCIRRKARALGTSAHTRLDARTRLAALLDACCREAIAFHFFEKRAERPLQTIFLDGQRPSQRGGANAQLRTLPLDSRVRCSRATQSHDLIADRMLCTHLLPRQTPGHSTYHARSRKEPQIQTPV